ncbi:MAG: carbohydrate kinase family protein [Candidatus Thorarchaeota archaeon]|jgi:sugar/nucleoside kinase (ribokinase family)
MEIVVVGHLSRDLIITPEMTREALGGGTAYAMLAMNLEAFGAGIISCVGTDFEEEYVQTLRDSGLDIDGLKYRGRKSTRFVNEYDENGVRTQRLKARAPPLKLDDMQSKHLGASIYHFSPLTADEIPISLIETARSSGGLVSLDAQGYLRACEGEEIVQREWPDCDQVISLVDVVKLDDSELEVAVEAKSELSAVTELLGLGPRMVIVTRDRRGSTIYTRNIQVDIPLVLADAQVDSTGCGDSYAIGFLLEYVRTGDVRRAGLFGATCSSFNVETLGPYNLPNKEQVLRRMKPYSQA